MYGHGAVGRTFAGRIVQVITGSTGIDDWEWGVTLFGVHPDDLKECVYTMRFDEGSARFAEFGPFLTGMVAPVEDVLAQLAPRGVRPAAVTDLAAHADRRASAVDGRQSRDLADLDALRCRAPVAGRCGRGLQRRRRLRLRGPGGHRHPRGRPGPVRDRRLPVARPRGARRLPGPGRRVGPPPPRGDHRRAGRPGLRRQRRQPLLPLQVVADGRPRSGHRGRRTDGHRGPRGQPRRPGRPPTRPGRRRRAGRGVPPGDGRVHQGRRHGPGRVGWACGRGTSRPPPAWPPGCPTVRG